MEQDSSLRCSAWKGFRKVLSRKMLGPKKNFKKKFGSKKNFVWKKNFSWKKNWVRKSFGLKMFLVPVKFLVWKFWALNKFWSGKFFWVLKKFWKKIGSKINFGSGNNFWKKLWVQNVLGTYKISGLKILGPTKFWVRKKF